MHMEFGLALFTSDRGIRPEVAAQAAEERGFHTFYVPEHTHIPAARTSAHPLTGDASLPDDRYMRTLDPWVALAGAMNVTSRIRLGTSVALPTEHDPITLAKTIASVDFLSGGRVVLGVGFGWNTEELLDHGVPPQRRRTVLREYLEAMRALWNEDEASYKGEFVNFGPSWAWPKPLQSPIPVLVGAGGTDRTLDWIVAHADGWITTPTEERSLDATTLLRERWAAAGRAGQPRVSVLGMKADGATISKIEEVGVTEMVLGVPDADVDTALRYLDKLEPLIAEFSVPPEAPSLP
jgi:probable F420-dependent oxidoreductase